MLTFCATVLVLLAMVLSFRLARYFSQAANGLLAQDAIWQLLGLQAVRYLVILIPLAMLLSIMLSLGRLYRDNEMTALTACGVGPGAIYRALLTLSIPIAVILMVLSLYVLPQCMNLQFELQARARKDAEISVFRPGVFREVADGKHVIYVGSLAEEGHELRQVFIRSWLPEGIAITSGKQGYQEIKPRSGARYVILSDGYRHEIFPTLGEYRQVRFERVSVLVDSGEPEDSSVHREAVPTMALWDSDEAEHVAEIHNRLSGPISLLLIVFLAPLLARANPREGRYGRVVAAILVYVIYVNLMGVGEVWLIRETVWPTLGLWWVHCLIGALILGLWIYQYGLDFVSARHIPDDKRHVFN